ncbi:MAG: carotenoid biosynthesis protein [Aureispira sp.]|nr:carotenoid biosynthesis protein [Aureispira sp.]
MANIKTQAYQPQLFLGILILFHLIGLGLFLYPNGLQQLSGLNMLLCATLVFLAAKHKSIEGKLLGGIILGGFLIEAVGVNTGYLFGNYEYGKELGFKLFGVPVVLGLNWYCVIAASSHIVLKHFEQKSLVIQILIAASLTVILDYLIEPVAMAYDFWSWEGGVIPLYNYICWFVFSLMFTGFYLWQQRQFNAIAYALYWVWAAFFLILNLI